MATASKNFGGGLLKKPTSIKPFSEASSYKARLCKGLAQQGLGVAR
jgi:hypothetical protein